MTVQTTVSNRFPVALAGDTRGTDFATQTRMAAVAVQAGLGVCMGSGDELCKVPTSAADAAKLLGIARSRVARDSFGALTPAAAYQIGDAVDILTRGLVWVTVEDTVAPGDPVYVRHTARETNTVLGAFRPDADTAAYVDYAALVTGARFLTTASAGELALVDLNLPQ